MMGSHAQEIELDEDSTKLASWLKSKEGIVQDRKGSPRPETAEEHTEADWE